VLAGAVAHEALLVDAVPRLGEVAPVLPELLASRTGVEIALLIIGEVGPLEDAIAALGLAEDTDVPLDPALVDEPAEIAAEP
jgi:hypothetical protein